MNTDLETIAMLRDTVSRYAEDRYGFQQRWAVLDRPAGYSSEAWKDLAELGLLALRLPEDEGGIGGDAAAVGAVMEVVGARLMMEPYFASAVLATGLLLKLASLEQQAALLPQLADGSLILAFADEDESKKACILDGCRLSGTKTGVLQGDIAGKVIVSALDATTRKPSVVLVDANAWGVRLRPYRLLDGRSAAIVEFDAAEVQLLRGDAGEALTAVRDEAAVALCAESLGIATSLVRITAEYLKVRHQFGRAIGSNQALQHRMVDCFLLQEEIKALTEAAQKALSAPAAERERVVSGARAYVIHAARRIANEAVQMHGGLGVTDELDVSHYFRRLIVNASLFGKRDDHFARFVDSTLAA